MSDITQLKLLVRRTEKMGDAGLKARINFVCLVFEAGLYHQLIENELFDQHGIGERQFDTCFEMHDGDKVVSAIIAKTLRNESFKSAVIEAIGNEQYQSWVLTFNENKLGE